LRWLERNIALINRLAASGGSAALKEASDPRVARTLENLAAMGYTMRPSDREILCEGLRELIATIEYEWQDIISEARRLIETEHAVPYLGLMELFHIGDFVSAPRRVVNA
jgi:hypothetical protein